MDLCLPDYATIPDSCTVATFFHNRTAWLPKLIPMLHPDIILLLQEFNLSPHRKDRLIWKPDIKGNFSFKSAYQLLRDQRGSISSISHIWNSRHEKKISIFMWRMINSLLPFDNVLKCMTLNLPSKCCCCDHEDSLDHFFNSCPVAVQVWRTIHHFMGITDKSFSNIWERLSFYFTLSGLSQFHNLLLRLTPSITCWFLWKMRNAYLFDNVKPHAASVLIQIRDYVFYLFTAKPYFITNNMDKDIANHSFLPLAKKPPKPLALKVIWSKPNVGFKVNVDASWCKFTLSAGISFIIRNYKGDLISARGLFIHAQSPLEAEMKAIEFGLKYVCVYREPIIIESDCLNAINFVLNPITAHWKLFHLADDINRRRGSIPIVHCYREANKVADILAKVTLASQVSQSFCANSLPKPVSGLIRMDKLMMPSLRMA